MRTLYIAYSYLNGNSGGIYATRTHINLFSRLSSEMTLLFPIKKNIPPQGIMTDGIKLIPFEDNNNKIIKFLRICFGIVHRFKLDKTYYDKEKYDIVVFDSSVVSSRLIKKFHNIGIKTITIHHNYQIEYLKGDEPIVTLLPNLFWTHIYERQAVLYSDLNITLTNQDMLLLKKHYNNNSKFGVLGVHEFLPSTKKTIITNKDRSINRYIITGGLSSKQTENSILLWIKNYYPIIKQEDPNSTLTIAGKNPSQRLSKEIKKAGIRLVPSPISMEPYLRDSDYYICPTDRGGGLKLRIMDGLKYGLPVLTHNVSARGYEDMKKEGILFIYNDQDSFRQGVRNLIISPINKEEVINIYNTYFCFESGIAKLKKLLKLIDINF